MDNNNNNNNNQASSPGKALGGGGSGGSSTALSPADIRRKRLEALDKRQQQQQQQQQQQRPSPAAGTSSSSSPQGNQQPNQAVAKPPPPQQSSSPAVQPTTVSGTNTTATPSNPINNSTTTTTTTSANPLPDPSGNNNPTQVRGSPATSTTAAGSSSSLSSSAAAVPPPVAAQQQQPPPPPPSADPPIISRHPFPSIHNNNNNNYNRTQEEEDYDDEELQRALALSMAGDTTTDEESSDGNPNEEETTTTTPEKQMEKSLHIEPKFENNNPMMAFMNNNNNNNNSHNKTTTTMPCNILNFHYIMWDYPGITTENDQQRWLNQGINFKYVDAHLEACQSNTTTADSVMAAIILHYESWGLTQTHGGPCGVLASIQAEMLRLLLFGPRTVSIIDDDDNDNTSPSSGGGDTIGLEYPTQITNSVFESPADLHPPLLRKALAMSMAIIWTRASMAATAAASDSNASSTSTATSTSSTGGSPTTASTTTGTGTSETTTTNTTNTTAGMNLNPSVHIVLPKLSINAAALEWNHLKPWTSDTGGSGQSDHLVTYTISLYDDIGEEGMDTTPTVAADGGGGSSSRATSASSAFSAQQPHTKRPRVKSIGNYTEEEIRVLHALSHKVANFLCDTNALEWFQRPGGVLLMVMSLAMSRGIPNIQGDMDDPTAKLTSNFGHCSQELINLLLTGQAVSNVFDNTMRPSGELICRGIQSRPAIGYLSQLESMRYLEVGGYYKTPQFPIWVIGSTSHFTVLFGEVACLQESASDVLLEKVRRAFKRIDENESGFIQTQQLGEFLGLVDLTPTIVSEHAIPTLAATMEVHGAGIILWEDLWKRTSRLLTGATLETVLEWNGESLNAASSTSTAIVPVPEPQPIAVAAADASSSAEILSDEEYARRLQAELNGEIIPAPAPIAHQPNPQSPQPAATAATTTSQQAETYGKTFQLYHYNGLRGGTMKPFRVTRLSADEAIGASVSLGSHSHANHHNMMMGGGNAGGDLEDVLRSKWPSCKINWLGGHPPSID